MRAYARYGRGLKFVPFLWAYQNERPSDLLLMTVEVNGIERLFYFAAVYVPGSLYIVRLVGLMNLLLWRNLKQVPSQQGHAARVAEARANSI